MKRAQIFAQRPSGDPIKIAARAMRHDGVSPQRAIVRAMTDDMRARLGLPAAEWPEPSSWWDA